MLARVGLLAVVVGLSVCLSVCVCHTPVLYRNGCMDRADFFACRFPSIYMLRCILRKNRVPSKIRVLPSGTLSQTPDLEKFRNGTPKLLFRLYHVFWQLVTIWSFCFNKFDLI